MRSHFRLFWLGVAVGVYLAWRYMPRCEEAQQAPTLDSEAEKDMKAGKAFRTALRKYSEHREEAMRDRTNDATNRLERKAA